MQLRSTNGVAVGCGLLVGRGVRDGAAVGVRVGTFDGVAVGAGVCVWVGRGVSVGRGVALGLSAGGGVSDGVSVGMGGGGELSASMGTTLAGCTVHAAANTIIQIAITIPRRLSIRFGSNVPAVAPLVRRWVLSILHDVRQAMAKIKKPKRSGDRSG